MKIKVTKKAMEKVEHYFKTTGYSSFNKRKLKEISTFIKLKPRTIRKAIEKLKKEKNICIVPDVKKGGYFLVDPNNMLDVQIAREYYRHQKAKIINSWGSIRPTNILFPIGQMKFEYKLS
jgi:hypothetical protein